MRARARRSRRREALEVGRQVALASSRAPSRGRRARTTGAPAAGSRPCAPAAIASLGVVRDRRTAAPGCRAPRAGRRSARGPRRGRSPRPACPSSVTPASCRLGRDPQRRLAAELHDHALGLLDVDHLEHVLDGQRLEVEPVGGVVVGRDRLRVAVDHHRVAADLAHGHRGVHAAVVELDPLADAVRARAEDHDARPRAAAHLARRRASPPTRAARS